MDSKIAVHISKRDAICRSLDINAYTAYMKEVMGDNYFEPSHPSVPLAAMHKARLHINSFSEFEKEVSRQWLRQNGYKEDI